MTHHEQTEAARKFVRNWQGTSYEKGNTSKFWIDLLTNVFGVKDIFPFIFFEERVKENNQKEQEIECEKVSEF